MRPTFPTLWWLKKGNQKFDVSLSHTSRTCLEKQKEKEKTKNKNRLSMSLIHVLRRQKQEGICEFMATMVYIASSRPASITQLDPVSKQQQQNHKTNKKLYNL